MATSLLRTTSSLLLLFKQNPKPHFHYHYPSSLFRPISSLQCSASPSATTHRPNVVQVLEQRGLLESLTSQTIRQISSSQSLRVYCGFDTTAESLHLGNLLGIIVLFWFIRCGHSAVARIGGATARVGDPSCKSLERPELDLQTLEKNTAGISSIIVKILGGNENEAVVLNNYDWWKDVKLLDFLRDVERFARVVSRA